MPWPQFLDLLGMDEKGFRAVTLGQADLGVTALQRLSDGVQVNLGLILSGDIDYGALRRRYLGEPDPLPEKYRDPARQLSRANAVGTMYQHLALFQGEGAARQIFSRLQLMPEFFGDPTAFVSTELCIDLLTEVARESGGDQMARLMGTMSLSAAPPALARRLQPCRTVEEAYELLLTEIIDQHYDQLCHYRLEALGPGIFKQSVRIRPGAEAAFGRKIIGHRGVCLFKQGVYLSFLRAYSISAFAVRETHCLYRGDDRCEYTIEWTPSKTSRRGVPGSLPRERQPARPTTGHPELGEEVRGSGPGLRF